MCSAPAIRPQSTVPSSSTEPVVSVLVLTYNHERTIAGAIRSVLDQQFSQPWEVLVAEDCSTDATRARLAELAGEFPGRLTLLDRERNLGLSRNLEDALSRCRGRYISLLEGDDEWNSPHKLEHVVAALEARPDWTGCFHRCRVEHLDTNDPSFELPKSFQAGEATLTDLLRLNVIPTYSVMTYRAGVVRQFPEWHRGLACGDWCLNALHAAQGPLGYLPEVMTTYRVHARGMWSGKPIGDRWRDYETFWTNIDAHFEGRYHALIEASRREFLDNINQEFSDLKRIERRYHALGLDHIAAFLRRVKRLWRRDTNR